MCKAHRDAGLVRKMGERRAPAVLAAALLVVVFTLLGQVSSGVISWDSVGQLEEKFMRRHKLRESRRLKALNERMNVSSYGLYPQLTQQIRCQQVIDQAGDQEISPSSQTCSDDACLVEAMYMKTPLLTIDRDIDISNSLPLPTITTKMTISGKCHDHPCIIDAFGLGQIFVVGVGGHLTLQNLEIKSGYYSEGGAAVTVMGSSGSSAHPSGKLLALNVLFFNNSASGNGGAVLVKKGGALHVQNSVFDSNEASMGGAVYVQSSDDMNADCSLSSSCANFIGTAFMGNWADLGGAIYVNNAANSCIQPGKFECTTCSFNNNLALDDGGAIYMAGKHRGAMGNVKFSNFYNNTVEVASQLTGGAVAIEAGEPGGFGVEFNSFDSIYSQSFDNEISISVKAFANATLVYSKFLTNNTVACYGACNFCPTLSKSLYLANCSTLLPKPNPTSPKICPQLPPRICDWIPLKCNLPTSAPTPS
ncbi:hypothetical protein M758_3G204000 [Ceratodon purpureus]|nr:hypothetical protein M758_3G204000 [Ceratodon purpureus]